MLWAELEDNPKAAIADLEAVYGRFSNEPGFAATVAEASVSGVDGLARNGSWLLKHWVAEGNTPDPRVWEMVVENLDDVKHWEAILQFCQMFAATPCMMKTHAVDIASFLRLHAEHKTPFIRAWAITAFAELAGIAPAFQKEASLLVAKGRSDPAKSVQARMRHVADPDSAG